MSDAALVGRNVTVRGLKARPELNGMCAKVETLDAKSGRYATRVPILAHPILLKSDNLEAAQSPSAAIAAAVAAEHREEVKERVNAAAAGEIHESGHAVVLDLEHTGLTELPEPVGFLAELRELWLAGNELVKLPLAVGCLLRLRTLDLDGNALTMLPASIEHLVGLEALYCNSNRLVAVPDSIGKLRALKELRLSDNRLGAPGVCLGALPEEFGSLRSLRTLWLARNALSVVPDAICRLIGLEDLDLAGNALVALPRELVKLKRLTTLDLQGNTTLVWPPPDVYSQGAEAVRAWLAEDTADAATANGDTSDELVVLEGGVDGGNISYAHEASGSMHQPLAPQDAVSTEGGGEFIFPGVAPFPR